MKTIYICEICGKEFAKAAKCKKHEKECRLKKKYLAWSLNLSSINS